MVNPHIRGLETAAAAAVAFAIFHYLPAAEAPYALSLWVAFCAQYGVTFAKAAGQP